MAKEDFHNDDNDLLPHICVVNIDDLDPDPDKGMYQESLNVPYDSGAPARHVRTRMYKIPERNNEWVIPNKPLAETALMALTEPPIFGVQPSYIQKKADPQAPEPNEEKAGAASSVFAAPDRCASVVTAAGDATAIITDTNVATTAANTTDTAITAAAAVAATITTITTESGVATNEAAAQEAGAEHGSSTSDGSENSGSAAADGSSQTEGEDTDENKEEEAVIKLSPIAIDHDLIDEDGDVIDVPFMDLLSLVGQYMQTEGADSLFEANSSDPWRDSFRAKPQSSSNSTAYTANTASTAASTTTNTKGSSAGHSYDTKRSPNWVKLERIPQKIFKPTQDTTEKSATSSLSAKAKDKLPLHLRPAFAVPARANANTNAKANFNTRVNTSTSTRPAVTSTSKSSTGINDILGDCFASIDAQDKAPRASFFESAEAKEVAAEDKTKTKAKPRGKKASRSKAKS